MKPTVIKYAVIDRHTRVTIGTYKKAATARRVRDRKDLEYGAIRYQVLTVDIVERAR